MYPAPFEYCAPTTLDEALALLVRYGDDAKILAGGQSLIPMMKLRIAAPRVLVDINRIGALAGYRQEGQRIVFGALCRHAEIASAPLVREQVPLLADAGSHTADVQVRNRGTIGGSLAHADPAGDWPAALLALDTEVTIAGPVGVRTVPLRTFLVDAYSTQLDAGDMLTAVSVGIPRRPGGGAYMKFEKRAGDFAVASVGVQLTLDGPSRCADIAISLGAVGPTALRASRAEAQLRGSVITEQVVHAAAALVSEEAMPFEDTRGTVAYKRHLAATLFGRAFAAALERAGGRVDG